MRRCHMLIILLSIHYIIFTNFKLLSIYNILLSLNNLRLYFYVDINVVAIIVICVIIGICVVVITSTIICYIAFINFNNVFFFFKFINK